MPGVWRRCSSCKKEIALGSAYYACSVSTCNAKATNYVFCSVPCWDAHVPVERHRGDSAGAIEKRAPLVADMEAPKRKIIPSSQPSATTGAAAAEKNTDEEDPVLVVVSKVRKYISDRAGLNTSASAYVALTQKIKLLCDLAIESARRDSRKTVMDRDF